MMLSIEDTLSAPCSTDPVGITQCVRSAGMLLEAGGFLAPGTKETGLFREPEETDGAGEHEEA
jgi:hypothetical protein